MTKIYKENKRVNNEVLESSTTINMNNLSGLENANQKRFLSSLRDMNEALNTPSFTKNVFDSTVKYMGVMLPFAVLGTADNFLNSTKLTDVEKGIAKLGALASSAVPLIIDQSYEYYQTKLLAKFKDKFVLKLEALGELLQENNFGEMAEKLSGVISNLENVKIGSKVHRDNFIKGYDDLEQSVAKSLDLDSKVSKSNIASGLVGLQVVSL